MATQDPRARHRAAAEKVVERIASDPAYREALLEDPVRALITFIGLEYRPAEEVVGYANPKPKPPECDKNQPTCIQTCYFSCAPGGTCGKSCEYSRRA